MLAPTPSLLGAPTPKGTPNMARRRIVFIPNDNEHDYSKAEHFGRLLPITAGPVNKLDMARLHETFRSRMSEAHPDDYVMTNGLALLVGLAASIMAQRFERVNFLQWSRREGYIASTVLLREPLLAAGDER